MTNFGLERKELNKILILISNIKEGALGISKSQFQA